MAQDWVKLWTDILGDPKLMRAAREGARRLTLLPWLLAFAKKADDGGRLTVGGKPAEPVDIAALIPGGTVRDVARCLEECERLGILNRELGDTLGFTRWERRQAKPSDQPEAVRTRVARHRQRNAQYVTPITDDGGDTGNAAGVTPGNATEEKRRDIEGEENRKELPWPAEFSVLLQPIGFFNPGRVGRALWAAVNSTGVDRSREVVRAYADLGPHQKADGSFDSSVQAHKFCSPEKLAETWGFWMHETEPVRAGVGG